MGIGVGRRRRIAIYSILLNGYEIKKTELLSLLNEHMKNFLGKAITDPQLTNTLTELEKEDIIEKEDIERAGRGAQSQKILFLPCSYWAFYKVLEEIFQYELDKDHKEFSLKLSLINSRHAQTFININLIEVIELDLTEEIEMEFKDIKFKFTNEEAELLVNLLKLSPSALFYIITEYKEGFKNLLIDFKNLSEEHPEIKFEIIDLLKKEVWLNLKLKVIEDIDRNTIANIPIIYNSVIKFCDVEKYNPSELEETYYINGNTLESSHSNSEKK